MLVARTIESFFPYVSGPARQALEISRRLQDIKSPIFTSDYMARGCPEAELYEGVRVRRFPTVARIMRYCITPGFSKGLAGADLVHSHNYRSYQTQEAFRFAKRNRLPFVLSTHGSLLGYKAYLKGVKTLPYRAYDIICRNQVLMADIVIVSSRFEFNEARRFGVSSERIEHIPMGIDTREYITKRTPGDCLRLLYVGRISRNRNIEPIIRAVAKLQKVRLRIVGGESKSSSLSRKGYVEELKGLAGRCKNIEFAGAKYGPELVNEYKNADVFIYTSLSENFGQCILEAAASGLALVTTPVGVAHELIKEGKSGYFVDFNNPVQIREKINDLRNHSLRNRIGSAALRIVEQNFCWSMIISRYARIYRNLYRASVKHNPKE